MGTCFVIQPFDNGGKFDKRYADVFDPAIRDAGLEPYRVDNDPAVSVPVEEIQKGIRRSDACLADITSDNPNVWFELGYALAADKDTCLVCSDERCGKYPFDIQHRSIIRYRSESGSDFASLHTRITGRLKAIIAKSERIAIIEANSPLIEPCGLKRHEMMVLTCIAANREGPGDNVSHWTIKEDLERLGYNNLALNIGLEGLLKKGMISWAEEHDFNGNGYCTYSLESCGVNWICENHEQFNLVYLPRKSHEKPIYLEEDIPF